MPNFAPDFLTPIGGGHFRASGPTGAAGEASGGWIDIYDNNAGPSYGNGNPTISMDVVHWELDLFYDNEPLAISGLLGATDARLTGYRYFFRAIVVRDINCPPDVELQGIPGSQLVFWLGDITEGVRPTGGEVGSKVDDRFYWSPDFVIEKDTVLVRSKNSNRDVIIGRGRSHVFLCPEQGNPLDTNTIVGAYNKYYYG